MNEEVDGMTLSRIVRRRAGHRTTVTRLVNGLNEVIASRDTGRLRQMRQSLRDKIEILSRLDEQILSKVNDDQVESEIERADLVKEKAELAIINIDVELAGVDDRQRSRRSSSRTARSSPQSLGEEDKPPLRPSQATNADDTGFVPLWPSNLMDDPLSIIPSFGSHSISTQPPPFPSIGPLRDSLPMGTVTTTTASNYSPLMDPLPTLTWTCPGSPPNTMVVSTHGRTVVSDSACVRMCTTSSASQGIVHNSQAGIGVCAIVSTPLSVHAPLVTSCKGTPLMGPTPNVPIMSTCATVVTAQSRMHTVSSPHVSFPTTPWHAPTRVGPPPLILMTQPDPPSGPNAWDFTAHVSSHVHAGLGHSVPRADTQFTRVPSLSRPVDHREPVGVSSQTVPISQPNATINRPLPFEITFEITYPPLSCMPEMNDRALGPNLTSTAVPNVPRADTQFARAASLSRPVDHGEPIGVRNQTLPILHPSAAIDSHPSFEITYPPLSCMPEVDDRVQGPNPTRLSECAYVPREYAPTYGDAHTSFPNPMNVGTHVANHHLTQVDAHVRPTVGTCGPMAGISEETYAPTMVAPTNLHGTIGYHRAMPSVNLTRPTTQVKLPKLNMKKFNGNVTKWSTFWDSFASSVHNNPSLSSIDKFNYLVSLLKSTAAEAVAGLTPTDANYEEAISTLRKRFGNPQMIINRHMEALLSVPGVASHQDIRSLRKLHDSVETHVRGLRALRVPAHSYGALLASALVNKLPPELKLIITREMGGSAWDLEQLMTAFERELDARERVFVSSNASNASGNRKSQTRLPTAATLIADSSGSKASCVYCKKEHASSSCSTVTKVADRKETLRRDGRCFVCIKKHHLSRDCRSNVNCRKCKGRHHVSICNKGSGNSSGDSTSQKPPSETSGTTNPPSETSKSTQTTNSHCAIAKTEILLQTARLHLVSPEDEATEIIARAMFDSGSQRTYVSERLRDRLQLPAVGSERMQIKTFGSLECSDRSYDVIQLKIRAKEELLTVTALVVPLICSPLMSQPINSSSESYEHLADLELADSADTQDLLEVDVLIGSDWYWSLITGKVIRGRTGPIAIDSKVGWILSGPSGKQTSVNLTFTPTHILRIDAYKAEPSLEDQLKQFWELESLGIPSEEPPVHERFLQQISFNGQRYEVGLPWKGHHPPLQDHYELCCKRLGGLLRRLKQTPQILDEYHRIITDQLDRGIIERVPQTNGDSSLSSPPWSCLARQDYVQAQDRI